MEETAVCCVRKVRKETYMAHDSTIRFFDMFSGIGGFRAGLERAGGFTCVGHSEIDKHADRAYRTVHNVKENEVFYEDARKIETRNMPDFDLLTAGFPCQSFSIAGKRKGFDDKRGTLFFEIAKVVGAKRPPYLLLENVPGLLSHDKGRTFASILTMLDELGYHVEWAVLNSKDFGVPQSRKRVYIIGYLDVGCAGKILPVGETNPKTLKILINGGHQSSRVYDPTGLSPTLTSSHGHTGLYAVGVEYKSGIIKKLDNVHTLTAGDWRGLNRRHEQNAVLETIPDTSLKIKEAIRTGYKEACHSDSVDLSYLGNSRRGRVGKNVAHTLTTRCSQGVVTPEYRIRRLVPRECFRLQGFDEEQIDKLLSINSDTQAYKQAGNAVTVNVVHAIGINIKAIHKELLERREKL